MVPSTPSPLLNTDHNQTRAPSRQKENFNEVDRGAPGDASLIAMVQREPSEVKRARQKSSFYGEVFAYREPTTPKDRVARESPITAEIKTNVIVRIYPHPQCMLSSILCTLSHATDSSWLQSN